MHENGDFLTIEEWLQLDTLLYQKQVPIVEAPVAVYKPRLDAQGRVMPGELLVMEQRGLCKLSEETRQAELARMSAEEKRKYISWVRGQGKRRRGQRHHKSKQATRRRQLEKNWATNPFGCILHRSPYACKRLDRGLWDSYIAPLWEKYDPKNLTVDFPRTAGTKVNPWTVYNMTVKHKGEVVYEGANQLLYDLSAPKTIGDCASGEDQLLFDLSKPAGDPRGANV